MIRKIILIIVLASGLGVLLYLKPWRQEEIEDPRIIDRLPTADFIGVMNPLELIREMSSLINSNKLKYRQFLNYDFLLSQSRALGMNLQNPVYLFGYENGNWGCIIELNDDSKIESGLGQISSVIKLEKKNLEGLSYLYSKKRKLYIFHEKNYILFYHGNDFSSIIKKIHKSNFGEASTEWINFINDTNFKNESFIISSNWKKFKQFGIEKAVFSTDNDSKNIKLKGYFKKTSPFYIAAKTGPSIFNSRSVQGNFLNIHLNIDEFRKHKEDILYSELKKLFRTYGVSFDEFIDSWRGDLSFFQGGKTPVTEEYKETELDDEFNPVMVEKKRLVLIPVYSALLTVNNNFYTLYGKLKAKGIITESTNKIRFFTSPPLTKIIQKNKLVLFSGRNPKTYSDYRNEMQWEINGTKYTLQLEKVTDNFLFTNLTFPIQAIAKSYDLTSR
ncbi:MAG: hypothetical protein FJX80_05385 [Bacteroidetes bacterium]|nr:hypothetical protein [Bacteroidota bacterium]